MDNVSEMTIRLMTPDEAAAYMSVAAKTLANWRYIGIGPPYYKIGAGVRYRRSDLDAFIAANERRPSA